MRVASVLWEKKIEVLQFREGLLSQSLAANALLKITESRLPQSIPKQLRSILFFTVQALDAVLIHTKHVVCVAGSIELGYWREIYLFKATQFGSSLSIKGLPVFPKVMINLF